MSLRHPALFWASVAALAVTCGCGAAVEPREMTVAEHECAARVHQSAARDEARDFEVRGTPQFPCILLGSSAASGHSGCWERTKNPTADHGRAASENESRAKAHVDASEALRSDVEAACVHVPAEDRAGADLFDEIVIAQPLMDRDDERRLAGAVLLVRAAPEATAERLQAAIECRLAQAAAFGATDDASVFPRVRRNVTARVIPLPPQFLLELRTEDPADAEAILASARAAREPLPARSR